MIEQQDDTVQLTALEANTALILSRIDMSEPHTKRIVEDGGAAMLNMVHQKAARLEVVANERLYAIREVMSQLARFRVDSVSSN